MRLSREGVFPIVTDTSGRPLRVATGLSMSGTIQGEGKLCGTSALFVRLQGCNLRCHWTATDGSASPCDTAHTWRPDGTDTPVSDVLALLRANIGKMRHVVITGGEPYLQADEVCDIIDALHADGIHVTVETNGTIRHDDLTRRVDLLSVSPKLSSSGQDAEGCATVARNVAESIRVAKCAGNDVQLKFVFSSPADEAEILTDYAEALTLVEPSDVILMPLGATPRLLNLITPQAVEAVIRNGWRYGPRLHISLFGNREGT